VLELKSPTRIHYSNRSFSWRDLQSAKTRKNITDWRWTKWRRWI